MSKIPVAYFHQKVIQESPDIVYPAKCLAVPCLHTDPEKRKQWFNHKEIEFLDINSVFRTYNATPGHYEKGNDPKVLFTHISGGIGDVIAFSAIAEYLRDKTLHVYCDAKFFPVFEWFTNSNIKLHPFHDPIITDYTPTKRLMIAHTHARLRLEYAAVEAGCLNWYDAMFRRIGLPGAPEGFNRPWLAPDLECGIEKNNILIGHRASCQMRSSEFADFYIPVKEAYPDSKIFVHERDLTTSDLRFITREANDVNIIEQTNIAGYLFNLTTYSLVVSTDTAAVHFREGLGLPCLAVYGAIPAEIRTSGYRFARSFNVKSSCPFQPCLKHELFKNEKCPNSSTVDITARCQTGKAFQEQLLNELKSFKNDTDNHRPTEMPAGPAQGR